MSTSLLRVHDELSKVARTKMADDAGFPTDIPAAAVSEIQASEPVEA